MSLLNYSSTTMHGYVMRTHLTCHHLQIRHQYCLAAYVLIAKRCAPIQRLPTWH